MKFSPFEVAEYIKNSKNNAPGFDIISNEMLKNLPVEHFDMLVIRSRKWNFQNNGKRF